MVRLLLIVDSPGDRYWMIQELGRDWPQLQVEVILNADGFDQALTTGSFDLVITDCWLCWGDGLTLIQVLKSRCPDCPVIVFTDRGSEEIAVAALKAGADDYIPKFASAYARLRDAIRSALQGGHQERRQKAIAGEANAAKYRHLLDAVTEGLWLINTQAYTAYVNQSMADRLGYAVDEMVGRSLLEFVVEGDRDQAAQHLLRSSDPSVQHELRFYHQDGSERWVLVRAKPMLDDEGHSFGILVLVTDPIEQRQAETSLRESEQRLQDILDCSNAVIYIKDLQGHFTLINRQFEMLLQLPREEIIGKTDYDLFPKDLADVFRANDQRILQSGVPAGCEEVAPRQGKLHTYLSLKFPLYDANGEVYGICGISTDISNRKQAEVALQHQAERERLLALIAQRIRQSLNLGEILNTAVTEIKQFLQVDRVIIYQFRPDWSGVVIAEAIADHCSSLLGRVFYDPLAETTYVPQHQRGEVWIADDIYTAGIERQQIEWLEQLQVRADLVVPILQGDQLWGLLVAHQCFAPRHWQSLEVDLLKQLAVQVAIALQQSDLYHRLQQLNSTLEHQVQERTAQLRQALEFEAVLKRITDNVRDSLDEDQILQTAVWELAGALGVINCNAAIYDIQRGVATIQYEYSTLLSAKGRTLQFKDFPELYQPLLQGQYFQYCPMLFGSAQMSVVKLACPIFDAEGVLADLWLTRPSDCPFNAQEIRLVQQVANQCAIAMRQARLYQAAQAQVAELQRLNQLKDDFLSTVSHELRTPVTNMRMAIKLLKVAPASERKRHYLDILEAECNREVSLINDLLSLQRLEASPHAIACNDVVHLSEWLPPIIRPFQSRIQERQQQLNIDVPPDLPHWVTDASSLERILVELLNNACKYTSAGGQIVLNAHVESARSNSSPVIVLSIRNQAEIPEKELPHIFEKFYRVPSSDPWKQGGTGLGLALVQKLVEQLQGDIQVHSEDGWITFTMRFETGEASVE